MNKKYDQEIIDEAIRLRKKGDYFEDIARSLKVPLQTVYYWWTHQKDVVQEEYVPGPNADRHLCRKCKYRGERGKNGCDYNYITGHMRKCPVEHCTRFVKGKRIEKPVTQIALESALRR